MTAPVTVDVCLQLHPRHTTGCRQHQLGPACLGKLPLKPATLLPACSPFVVHLKPSIAELAKEYQARGVKVLAISSNSVETHPQARRGRAPVEIWESAVLACSVCMRPCSSRTGPFSDGVFHALHEESLGRRHQAACHATWLVGPARLLHPQPSTPLFVPCRTARIRWLRMQRPRATRSPVSRLPVALERLQGSLLWK